MATDLRSRALAHTRRWIPFAKRLDSLLADLPFESWDVVAVTNGDPRYEEADLADGLGGGPKKDDAVDALADLAMRHLSKGLNECVVVEHALALPTDPFLDHEEVPFVQSGDGIYYFATPDVSLSSVRQVLSSTPDYPYVGCFSALPVGLLRNRDEVDPAVIELISSNAEAVLIGAFDGEGYLVWTPATHPAAKRHS
jgi:hypothetical protein